MPEGNPRSKHDASAGLGFTRTPSEDDPRREPNLLDAIARIAPGTDLRQGIDDIIRSHEGALIVDESPSPLQLAGAGCILMGLVIATVRRRPVSAEPELAS